MGTLCTVLPEGDSRIPGIFGPSVEGDLSVTSACSFRTAGAQSHLKRVCCPRSDGTLVSASRPSVVSWRPRDHLVPEPPHTGPPHGGFASFRWPLAAVWHELRVLLSVTCAWQSVLTET